MEFNVRTRESSRVTVEHNVRLHTSRDHPRVVLLRFLRRRRRRRRARSETCHSLCGNAFVNRRARPCQAGPRYALKSRRAVSHDVRRLDG